MIRRIALAAVLTISTVAAGIAATQATLILKNGERHTGTLVYRKDANFNLVENGQERSWPQSEVAVIDIAGGTPSSDELSKLSTSDAELERNLVVLRNGSTVMGKLYNINANDSITIDTKEGQRRDINLSDISRIYMSNSGARSVFNNVTSGSTGTTGVAASTPAVPGAVMVQANQQWTDTGITVRRGDRVSFQTSGTIKYGTADDMSAGPDGNPATSNMTRSNFPVGGSLVGALVARVGNSAAFSIGSNSAPIQMPADGRLYLGVNDDNYGDNSGAFAVVITRQNRR
jgi:hypothetical protein